MPSVRSAAQFRIAIIGAGPAGLTLASLLTASPHDFDYTVFDLRAKPDPSEIDVPSGNLDLQEGFGLQAIKACGLYDEFLKIDSGCTEQTIINDKHKTVFFDHVGEGRPEISRNALAHLLLSSIPSDKIHWKTKVLSVKAAQGAKKAAIEYKSVDGPSSKTDEFDLIVGADGAWSAARAAIAGAPTPVYSGACSVTLDIPTLTERDPALNKMLGGGTFAVCGDQKVVLSQRGIHDSSRLYLFIHSKVQAEYAKELKTLNHDDSFGPNPKLDEHRLLNSLPKNHKDLKEYLLNDPEFFSSWAEEIKHLLTVAFDSQPAAAEVDARPLYMLPLDPYPYPHTRGIALIGDAAHLMTPFAGKGVNVAMADSLSLAKQLETLASGPSLEGKFEDDLDRAVAAYEEAAHPRGKQAMTLTWLSLGLSYDEGGPGKLVKVMAANH